MRSCDRDSSKFLPRPWCQWPLLAHRGTVLHPGGHVWLPSTGVCHLAGSVAGVMISRGGGGGERGRELMSRRRRRGRGRGRGRELMSRRRERDRSRELMSMEGEREG